MPFFDFVMDLMWGTSEIFFARKEHAVARANRKDGDPMSDQQR